MSGKIVLNISEKSGKFRDRTWMEKNGCAYKGSSPGKPLQKGEGEGAEQVRGNGASGRYVTAYKTTVSVLERALSSQCGTGRRSI